MNNLISSLYKFTYNTLKNMDEFTKFYTGNNYNQHMYTGLIGYLMKLCHKSMEYDKSKKDRVLEIGPGTHPHIDYLKHDYDEYYILEKIEELENYYKDREKVIFICQKGDKLPFDDDYFDRIILSHCLEHIIDPEVILLELFSKLKKGGNITIGLPTDPGFLWRLGKFISANFLIKKNYKFSKEDYYYFTAKDHVNSIFSLIPIIKKNFKNISFQKFEPFKVPLIDLNLFYIIDIKK